MTDAADVRVDRVDERHRYEITYQGEVAGFAIFREKPGATVFTHTVVLPEYEGKGLGSRLVKAALDDVVARGERIVPVCPFVAAYLDRHPEYAESVGYDDEPGA